MKWIWLDDEPTTISDIRAIQGLPKFELFTSLDSLISFLINCKNQNQLSEYGLILDVMLKKNLYITIPTEWSGESELKMYKTNDGYDAGLVFYEKAILYKTKEPGTWWSPPPPVIFLSVMTLSTSIPERLNLIKQEWSANQTTPCNPSDAKVRWIRKWETEDKESEFIKLLNKWTS